MVKTDIFSGFLGAGKTTLIKKLIAEGYKNEKLVLIENEFGDIAIDGGFLKDAGVEITEMNSGCICCTLVGDFRKALQQVVTDYSPDRIVIEPSGVGKLSDVAKAVAEVEGIKIGAKITVADAGKCRMYMKNFGEFFNDQIANADIIVLSRTDTANEAKTEKAVSLLREINHDCTIITTPWDKITGEQILKAADESGLKREMAELEHEEHEHHHHHHHDEDDEHECCHHDHEEHEEHDHECHHHEHEEGHHCHEHDGECCHGHEHDHEHEEHEHEHHHDHEHGEGCSCGCHDHDHHHHHADEIFSSWGFETPKKYTVQEISDILDAFEDWEKYGTVLRAKGYVDSREGDWIYFDYVPDEKNIRTGSPDITGRICVIGSKINEDALKELFGIE